MISDYKTDVDISITTNGYLLKEVAQKLKDAGLKRVNISLDSLKPEIAQRIAQKDVLKNVLEGTEEALKVGFKVKINCVPLKGFNDGEIIDLLEYAKKRGLQIRFIEYMENTHANKNIKGLYGKEIVDKIREKYEVKKIGREGSSPAFLYELEDGYRFGIIDPHKHDFCENCNRIRLTAEGNIIPCLYFDEAMSIAEAVKKGDTKATAKILREVLKNKPEKNRWDESLVEQELSNRAFYQTGG